MQPCLPGRKVEHFCRPRQLDCYRTDGAPWQGCLIAGGAINDGFQIRSMEVMGADLAYVGTRFLASVESNAVPEYKRMILDANFDDLINTDRLSGVGCNFLKPSLERHGIRPQILPAKVPDMSSLTDTDAKLWKDLWTAGHGVTTIHDIPSVGEIVSRMAAEYHQACALPPSRAVACGG